jgi:hypothetical protein
MTHQMVPVGQSLPNPKTSMPRKPATQSDATPRAPSLKQADLWVKFPHLNRQRVAGRLAERILRMVSTVDDETALLAIEIASTAAGMRPGQDGKEAGMTVPMTD